MTNAQGLRTHRLRSEWLIRRSCRRLALAVCFSLLVGACGSGGDDGNSGGDGVTPPPPAPPTSSLKIEGTAATGAPIVAAPVEVKCAAGTGAGTTGADGTYSVDIAAASLPCVLRVAPVGSAALHSLATGTGATVRANLTPVTELIVASLVGGVPAEWFSSFDGAAASRVTGDAVSSASAAVLSILRAAGLDFGAGVDPIGAAFTAAAGDPYDAALVRLSGALTSSGTTLPDLTRAVAASSAGASSTVVALPPDRLLQPAAASCAAMRSGTYRIVSPTPSANLGSQTSTLVFDAGAMSVSRSDGSTGTWTANGECRFTDQGSNYTAEVVVSQAGVIVGRMTRGGVSRDFIGFAEQAHAVDKLAGTWNTLGLEWSGTAFFATSGTVTFDAGGRIVSGTDCTDPATWSIRNCVVVPDSIVALFPPITSDASGGFAFVEGGAATSRLFAYRAGSGDFMLIAVSMEGNFSLYVADRPVVPQAVGTTSTSWGFDSNASYLAQSAIGEGGNTVTASDSTSWTRLQTAANGVQYSNTLLANNPRQGYVHRDAGTTTGSNGLPYNFIQLDWLRTYGMGVTPVLLTTQRVFQWSVVRP